jgi:hypothetical protein
MQVFRLLAFTHLAFSLFLTIFVGCLPRPSSVAGCPVTWLSPRFIGTTQPAMPSNMPSKLLLNADHRHRQSHSQASF